MEEQPPRFEIPIAIEFATKPREHVRELGWWSRITCWPFLSDWIGPFESQKKAADFWQQKLATIFNVKGESNL